MINNENDKNEQPVSKEAVPTDTALMQVDAHIIIKELDTEHVLLNRRG